MTLLRHTTGAVSVEYAIIAAFLSIIMLAAFAVMAGVFDSTYMSLVGSMSFSR